MAEILGAVAGTAGLLHLTLKGTKLVYDLTSRYRHAFDEIDRLCGELEWLGHLLEAVQSLPGHSSSLLSSSDALGAAVSQCDQAIKDLHALLGRFIPDEPRLKREAVKSRIRKVIKDRKLQAATERLEQAKVSLLLAQTNLASKFSQMTVDASSTVSRRIEELQDDCATHSSLLSRTCGDIQHSATEIKTALGFGMVESTETLDRLSPLLKSLVTVTVTTVLQQQDSAARRDVQTGSVLVTGPHLSIALDSHLSIKAPKGRSSKWERITRARRSTRCYASWLGTIFVKQVHRASYDEADRKDPIVIEMKQSTNVVLVPAPWLLRIGCCMSWTRVRDKWNQSTSIVEIASFNVVAGDSPIAQACGDLDLMQVRRLFDERQASPRDRSPAGHSLLFLVLNGIIHKIARLDSHAFCSDDRSSRTRLENVIELVQLVSGTDPDWDQWTGFWPIHCLSLLVYHARRTSQQAMQDHYLDLFLRIIEVYLPSPNVDASAFLGMLTTFLNFRMEPFTVARVRLIEKLSSEAVTQEDLRLLARTIGPPASCECSPDLRIVSAAEDSSRFDGKMCQWCDDMLDKLESVLKGLSDPSHFLTTDPTARFWLHQALIDSNRSRSDEPTSWPWSEACCTQLCRCGEQDNSQFLYTSDRSRVRYLATLLLHGANPQRVLACDSERQRYSRGLKSPTDLARQEGTLDLWKQALTTSGYDADILITEDNYDGLAKLFGGLSYQKCRCLSSEVTCCRFCGSDHVKHCGCCLNGCFEPFEGCEEYGGPVCPDPEQEDEKQAEARVREKGRAREVRAEKDQGARKYDSVCRSILGGWRDIRVSSILAKVDEVMVSVMVAVSVCLFEHRYLILLVLWSQWM